jgi:hypothetical protein
MSVTNSIQSVNNLKLSKVLFSMFPEFVCRIHYQLSDEFSKLLTTYITYILIGMDYVRRVLPSFELIGYFVIAELVSFSKIKHKHET